MNTNTETLTINETTTTIGRQNLCQVTAISNFQAKNEISSFILISFDTIVRVESEMRLLLLCMCIYVCVWIFSGMLAAVEKSYLEDKISTEWSHEGK